MIKAKIIVEITFVGEEREMNGREEGYTGAFNYLWNVSLN